MDHTSTPTVTDEPTAEWCTHHFDHLSEAFSQHVPETLERLRHEAPVTWSDANGGFWVVSRYEDVLKVAQDWRTFSSAHGVSVPESKMTVKAIPEHLDPPLHREYKRLINAWFTPAIVHQYEDPTRDLVTRLIDEFIERGSCEFMDEFARPLPGRAFFEQVLHAPPDEVADINAMAGAASLPTNPNRGEAWAGMFTWISELVERRRQEGPRDDVVDAVLAAQIEGRPIRDEEIIGVIQLLILGGLETTAGALGQIMIRFAHQPEIPELLRDKPELTDVAIEEMLRLDPPFVAIVRTAMTDTEIGGQAIEEGDKVMILWASANRDEGEFACPHQFDLERHSNRHLTFGAGPHRCTGSNLARMNLRLSIHALTERLRDIRLQPGSEPLAFHSALNRGPLAVPITFTPGPKVGA